VNLTRLLALFAIPAGLAFSSAGRVPLRGVTFEPNVGQADARAKYLAHTGRAMLWLTERGAVLSIAAGPEQKSGGVVLKLRFEGGNPAPRMEGEDLRAGVSNYFLGRDSSNWHTGVRQFGKVRYRDVYPGIDAVFYGNPQDLEYDFVVRPGADPSRIKLTFEGADSIAADANGDLRVKIASVEIRNRKPRIYQQTADGDKLVGGGYVVLGRRRAGFTIDRYDPKQTLVVDPILSYATYFGGSGADIANAIAMDAQGNLYVAGSTNSNPFPRKAGVFEGLTNSNDVGFLAKFNPAAAGANSLIYSTFLGGNYSDEAFGVAVDKSGNAYVTGRTLSPDFPLKNAFQNSFSTATNCADSSGNPIVCHHSFVTEVAASGEALVYSSYLGGTNQDEAFAIGVDANGSAYVTGQTLSIDFPTAGSPYQSTQQGLAKNATQGAGDAFLSEIAPKGTSLVYSTYFGGDAADSASTIAVEGPGVVCIAGNTVSTNLPMSSNAFQSTANEETGQPTGTITDAFVAEFKLAQGGTQALAYSSYLGGNTGSTSAAGVAVDSAGAIYVTGATNALDYWVSSGAFHSTNAGNLSSNGVPGIGDAFITKLNPAASGKGQLAYSTYMGGALDDEGLAIAVDAAGLITVAGITDSPGFPVTGNAFQRYDSGPSPTQQGFVSRFDPAKSGAASLIYSTFLGGDSDDLLYAIAVDPTGTWVAVAGTVLSVNAPVTVPTAFQPTFGGSSGIVGDAYIAEFNFSESGPFCASIINSASLVQTGLSPGLIFTIKGNGIGPAAGQTGEITPDGRMATELAGVQVFVNGFAVPLLYVQSSQINAVAPYELSNSLGDNVNIEVYYNGVISNVIGGLAVIAAPAIFSLGDGQGAILNQDGSVNGPGNPAAKGSIIQIYATGEGSLNPNGVDGQIVGGSNLPQPLLPVSVTIDGATTRTYSASTAPDSIEGFFRVEVNVPGNVAVGNNPVVLTVGGIPSTPLNVVVK
jgi:uncharacterized protein (TIGR03437 family)